MVKTLKTILKGDDVYNDLMQNFKELHFVGRGYFENKLNIKFWSKLFGKKNLFD